MKKLFALISLLVVIAGCEKRPARDTLPIVHVICSLWQGQGIDSYMTRAKYDRLAFSAAVPCVFEWGEEFPGNAVPSPVPTVVASNSLTPSFTPAETAK